MIVFVFWNALRQIAVKAIGIFAYETFQARRACVMKTRFIPDALAGVCPDWVDLSIGNSAYMRMGQVAL
ncbi:MAG: hypothetical protein HYX49_09545 [Chloroflexi bacterium]|nr:hypothetical protein [Chloroflexota bacterium]